MSKMSDSLKSISEKLDTEKLLVRALHEWQPVLANDINVFSCEHGFLAKRFNEINFQFCAEKEAQQIVKDNLYAILRYKYFTVRSDDIDERIDRIIGSFCRNLATTLPRITFDENIAKSEGLKYAQYLPDGCVAFSNGVYDFRKMNGSSCMTRRTSNKYQILCTRTIQRTLFSGILTITLSHYL